MSIGQATVGDSTVSETVIPHGTALNAPVDIHPALEQVRRMREFEPPRPGLADQLLSQPWARHLADQLESGFQSVLEAIQRLFGHVAPPAISHLPQNVLSLFSGFLGFLLILAGMYVFYLLLTTMLHLQERNRRPPAPPARRFDQSLLVNAAHHRSQAAALAQAGQYEDALRELFLCALCLLDERAWVPFDSTRTNREYLEALAATPARNLKPVFAQLCGAFEAVRYGKQPLSPAQYAACDAGIRQLESGEAARA